MISSNNLLRSQSAASRARSLLAYPFDMSRRSLIKQLAIRLSQQAGKSLVIAVTKAALWLGGLFLFTPATWALRKVWMS